jgi:hypothetical protein
LQPAVELHARHALGLAGGLLDDLHRRADGIRQPLVERAFELFDARGVGRERMRELPLVFDEEVGAQGVVGRILRLLLQRALDAVAHFVGALLVGLLLGLRLLLLLGAAGVGDVLPLGLVVVARAPPKLRVAQDDEARLHVEVAGVVHRDAFGCLALALLAVAHVDLRVTDTAPARLSRDIVRAHMSSKLLLLLLALGGCDRSVLGPADAGPRPDASCALDSKGSFTFHVANRGTRMLRLAYGCGATLPITLDAAGGPLPISPGPASYCEVSCDYIYGGGENNGCSDCGPGYGAGLPPGATVDIAWDRRLYVETTADPTCSGHAGGNECALGTLAGPAVSSGTLTVCNGGSPTSGAGYCASTDEVAVPFNFDPTASDSTIVVP